jgi:hypothetical protein
LSLPQAVFPTFVSYVLIVWVPGELKERNWQIHISQNLLLNVAKVHTPYGTVAVFFLVHSFAECDEQHIMNSELALFHLKHTIVINSCQIQIVFGKKAICTQVNYL